VLSHLAPARRRLVLALGAVVLFAAVVLGTVLVRGLGGADAPAVAADRPGPVVLVPGYGGSTDALGVLADRLRAQGRDATVVDLPDGGTGDLVAQATAVGAVVTAVLARTGAGSVDLVGYSAGGVVARIWLGEQGGAAVTRRVVTLGSPHHGTQVAGLGAALGLSICGTACQQLAPGSALLTRLNADDETPGAPQYVSLWTTVDQVVTPPDSARLDGALDLPLQDVCAGSTVDHSGLPRDPLVGAIVTRELGAGDVTGFTAADCAPLTTAG
jgi:pimeloyl-ACP methyl ester carboxylesterase